MRGLLWELALRLVRLPLALFALCAIIVAWEWLCSLGKRGEADTERSLDTWGAHELADFVCTRREPDRARVEAVLLGVRDAELEAWLDAIGAGADLTWERRDHGALESLRVFSRDGHRTVARERAWDELPSEARAAFLRGDATASVPWRAPWRGGAA